MKSNNEECKRSDKGFTLIEGGWEKSNEKLKWGNEGWGVNNE